MMSSHAVALLVDRLKDQFCSPRACLSMWAPRGVVVSKR